MINIQNRNPDCRTGVKVKGKFSRFLAVMLVILPFAVIFYNFIGGALCNDIKASQIEKSFLRMDLPSGTECVETTSFVGNASGTGNHTEIWAGMLIHSTLSKEELGSYFEDCAIHTILECMEDPFLASLRFSALSDSSYEEQRSGYFVVGNYYEAFTQSDMRGH